MGVLISVIDLVWPHTFSTILEVYYGTPYDRHVILEESSDVRYQKNTRSRTLEEPPGFGSRILRRLSSKSTHVPPSNALQPATSSKSIPIRALTLSESGGNGLDNIAYQEEAPKSPWRYPFGRVQDLHAHPLHLQRSLSQDSASSMNSAAMQISPLHKHGMTRMLP